MKKTILIYGLTLCFFLLGVGNAQAETLARRQNFNKGTPAFVFNKDYPTGRTVSSSDFANEVRSAPVAAPAPAPVKPAKDSQIMVRPEPETPKSTKARGCGKMPEE